MKKNTKKISFSIWAALCFVILSFVIKICISRYQIIWLDEQYSVAFAVQNSVKNLLFFFSQDVHPGGYYVILKHVLLVTHNLQPLRLFTSILPQTLGILLVIIFRKKLKLPPFLLAVLVFLLSFNPFFNYLVSQLRMYGFVFLMSVIDYLIFKTWIAKKQTKQLIFLGICLALGNIFSYSLFFLSLGYAGLVLWWQSNFLALKKKVSFSLIALGLLTLQFLLLSGTNLKSQFAEASWIAAPSIGNIATVYLTTLGLGSDVHNVSSNSWVSFSLVFIFVVIVIIYKKYFSKKDALTAGSNTSALKEIAALTLFPSALLLGLSVLLPFLSNRFFFHNFVPNFSLFLPRTHLPFIVSFFLILPQLLEKVQQKYLVWACCAVLPIWLYFGYQISFRQYQDDYNPKVVNALFAGGHDRLLVWPAWFWYKSVSLDHVDRVTSLEERVAASQQIEKIFWDEQKTIQESTKQFCSMTQHFTYLIAKQVLLTPRIPIRKLYASLNDCCVLQEQVDQFEKWQCENTDN